LFVTVQIAVEIVLINNVVSNYNTFMIAYQEGNNQSEKLANICMISCRKNIAAKSGYAPAAVSFIGIGACVLETKSPTFSRV
jgi:hypothetical protein